MLIILEGLDRVGKTTVAEHFVNKLRYDCRHFTAPSPRKTSNEYFAEMLSVIASSAEKNVVYDRSWYGELLWPLVFNRPVLLTDTDCTSLLQMAKRIHGTNGVKCIYMHDPNEDSHIKRMQENNEPKYDVKFARHRYDIIAAHHKFERMTLQEAEALGWT